MLDVQSAVLNVSLLWMLTVPHEFAHAWVADKLGDDTPRRDGRVTLHPMAHVDWLGTVILPLVTSLFGAGFLGWGRAVQTNPAKLRGGLNGLAMVALAGPASNIIFALVLGGLASLLAARLPIAAEFAMHGVLLSFYLAIFNLIPIPPLDGSKLLLAARIPISIYNEIARAGFLVLIVLLTATGLGRWMSALSYQAADTVFRLMRV